MSTLSDMKRTENLDTQHGTTDELVTHLREMSEGWHHLTKDKLSEAASDAADQLEAGAFTVKVGHTIYVVQNSDETTA